METDLETLSSKFVEDCSVKEHTENDLENIRDCKEKRKANFANLPIDVLRLIIDVSGERKSLTATNRYFYNLRRHLYWTLTKTYSLKYYEDEEFRTDVHSRLENPSIQLHLDLSGCNNITDVSALGGVHTLNLSGCSNLTDVSALGGVHTLDLSECSNITDVSALDGVHTLIR